MGQPDGTKPLRQAMLIYHLRQWQSPVFNFKTDATAMNYYNYFANYIGKNNAHLIGDKNLRKTLAKINNACVHSQLSKSKRERKCTAVYVLCPYRYVQKITRDPFINMVQF